MSVPQPRWIDRPTPRLSKRTLKIRYIILHHGGGTVQGDLAALTGPSGRVSADFYVDRSGRIYKLNPQLTLCYTWHAGESKFDGRTNLNRYSLGIEAEHDPQVHSTWTPAQYDTLAHLVAWLVERYNIPVDHVVGHKDVAWPRGRKIDPSNFDWDIFKQKVMARLETRE